MDPALEITWGLVVNGRPIPSEWKHMAILDPYNLMADAPAPYNDMPDAPHIYAHLVDFKATADVLWLEDALRLEHRSWKTVQKQVPFLQEIKRLVQVKRVYDGGLARAPRQSQDGKLFETNKMNIQ